MAGGDILNITNCPGVQICRWYCDTVGCADIINPLGWEIKQI